MSTRNDMKTEPEISADDITSSEIKSLAQIAGVKTITLLGVFDHPDHPGADDYRLRIYDFGGVRVAETNGAPVWEQADPAGWAELISEYAAK